LNARAQFNELADGSWSCRNAPFASSMFFAGKDPHRT
jgi:hypothetical protein